MMSEQVEEDIVDPKRSLKDKCVRCIRGPNLLKTLVIMVCTGIVIQQLTASINKLIKTPITTYTHFDFNGTLLYPSVTLCREPSYKYRKLLEYNLYSHPMYTSTWRNFNFANVSLDVMWDDVTYTMQDYFVQYGLDGSVNNVAVTPVMGFYMGRCFTITPEILSTRASRATGYTITLQHTAEDMATAAGTVPPGYHVFIHYLREPFTEVSSPNGGFVEYLFVKTGEEIDVKVTVDQYLKISEEQDPCTNDAFYNANNCTTKHVWQEVEEQAGCSGPWMESQLPRCSTYATMRSLITSYMNYYQDHKYTKCPRFCTSYLYNAFVTNRQDNYLWDAGTKTWTTRSGDASLQTQLYVHFNSMMVSVYEERYNYDWNLFVSDIGGSVGFLLGLSVIGLMTIVAKIWASILNPFIEIAKKKKGSFKSHSTTTEEVTPTDQQPRPDRYQQKYDDWNVTKINNN